MSEKKRAPLLLVVCWGTMSVIAWGGVGYALSATKTAEGLFAASVFFPLLSLLLSTAARSVPTLLKLIQGNGR